MDPICSSVRETIHATNFAPLESLFIYSDLSTFRYQPQSPDRLIEPLSPCHSSHQIHVVISGKALVRPKHWCCACYCIIICGQDSRFIKLWIMTCSSSSWAYREVLSYTLEHGSWSTRSSRFIRIIHTEDWVIIPSQIYELSTENIWHRCDQNMYCFSSTVTTAKLSFKS